MGDPGPSGQVTLAQPVVAFSLRSITVLDFGWYVKFRREVTVTAGDSYPVIAAAEPIRLSFISPGIILEKQARTILLSNYEHHQ